MSQMKTRIAAAALSLGLLAGCSSSPDPAPTTSSSPMGDTALAQSLATQWLTILQSGDSEQLDAFLSPAFQLVRADGSTADKTQYLAEPATVGPFEISGMVAGRDGNVLTSEYDVTITETVDGQPFKKSPTPRSSTFVDTGNGNWQLIAHANLNTPDDPALLNQKPSPLTDPAPRTYKAAAKSTQNAALQALTAGDVDALAPLISPGFLLLRADGSSADRASFLANPSKITSYKIGNFGVTQANGAVVARFVGTYGLEVDGTKFPAKPAQQFSVMVGEPPNLRVISIVNFNKPGD